MIIVIVRFDDVDSPETFGPFNTEKDAEDWATNIVTHLAPRGARCLITQVVPPINF
jgi:hypothetical protein